ncbi:sulfite exporter TauE/SafE family protein [Halobacillus shinanisalinarum]|uniref:Sulfite exporter TauE/SafE family protein n=1 Tax=Halobacillus shinanisalinarum TaxID=2932258 RepID=A0ABY4H0Q0_9BACI|nr:sulfite exporter TauE/SafE family protein [Halobacillus shinanisalinarum]UOQ94018.1 sulfite exporter TauE/SafE family protein [Halobacillus shinanisalinarum]
MYQIFSNISNFFSQPFFNLANQWEGIPLLSAFLLGLVGAVAPCQFTGNIGAITIYGNRSLQKNVPWMHVSLFVLGKLVVFSGLGLVVWLLGKEFQANFTLFIPVIRKLIGPILILIGLFMAGFFKMRWSVNFGKIPERYMKDSKIGSFLMGVSFTLAFCPTMFILFFMTLMPVVLSTSYGVVLPSVFAIGTSVPLLLSIFIIWYFELGGKFMKQGRKIGSVVQRIAGWILIIIGLLDTLTYW